MLFIIYYFWFYFCRLMLSSVLFKWPISAMTVRQKKPNLWTRKRKSVQTMALVQRAWHFKKTSQPDLPGREDCWNHNLLTRKWHSSAITFWQGNGIFFFAAITFWQRNGILQPWPFAKEMALCNHNLLTRKWHFWQGDSLLSREGEALLTRTSGGLNHFFWSFCQRPNFVTDRSFWQRPVEGRQAGLFDKDLPDKAWGHQGSAKKACTAAFKDLCPHLALMPYASKPYCLASSMIHQLSSNRCWTPPPSFSLVPLFPGDQFFPWQLWHGPQALLGLASHIWQRHVLLGLCQQNWSPKLSPWPPSTAPEPPCPRPLPSPQWFETNQWPPILGGPFGKEGLGPLDKVSTPPFGKVGLQQFLEHWRALSCCHPSQGHCCCCCLVVSSSFGKRKMQQLQSPFDKDSDQKGSSGSASSARSCGPAQPTVPPASCWAAGWQPLDKVPGAHQS